LKTTWYESCPGCGNLHAAHQSADLHAGLRSDPQIAARSALHAGARPTAGPTRFSAL
jgi:hypothetical protein